MGTQPSPISRFLPVLWFLMVTGGCASGPGVGSRTPSFSAIGDSGDEISLANPNSRAGNGNIVKLNDEDK